MKLKQVWFNARDALLGIGFISMLAYIVGLIVCVAIVKTSTGEEMTCAHSGTLLSLLFSAMFVVVINTTSSLQRFNQAICMSRTRKNFILQEICLNIVSVTVLLIFNAILFGIENLLIQHFYPGIPLELDLSIMFNILIEKVINIPAFIIIVSGFCFFISGAFIRFGQIAHWILWFCWMSLCLSTDKWLKFFISDEELFKQNVLNVWGMWNGYFCQIVGVLLAVLLTVVAAWLIRKQEVKGM